MFLPKKTIKNKKMNYPPKIMPVIKTTQYGEDVVMFLPNKIITHGFILHGLGGPCKWF